MYSQEYVPLSLCFSYMLSIIVKMNLNPMQSNTSSAFFYARFKIPHNIFTIRKVLCRTGLHAEQRREIAEHKGDDCLYMVIIRKLVLHIPLLFILPMFMTNKVFAVVLSAPISDVLSVVVTVACYSEKHPKYDHTMIFIISFCIGITFLSD